MDYQVRGSIFKDQFVIPSTPTPDISTCLSDSGLFALPYISLFIGIDARTPTKAVYALYDPEIAGIRFVQGDGTFVNAERVCFRSTFKDGALNLNRSQRLHFIELMNRSVQHYRATQECKEYRAKIAQDFSTISSIKASFTFVRDLQKCNPCPALRDLPLPEALSSQDEYQDHALPAVSITLNSPWDFSPFGFQAEIQRENDIELTALYAKYIRKYRTSISPKDFQQALFCLAGLMKAELVPFVLEGQNNPKYFRPHGVTPPELPKLLKPRRTSLGWTVDCFIARFERFEKLFNGGYERWPNPIAWLEAEIDREEVQGQQVRPWKLVAEKGQKEPKEPPVIDWETLQRLKWSTRGDYSKYPKSTISQKSLPLKLHDIISPNSFRFRESKKAKEDRRERNKAAQKIPTVVLTGNDTGHMNQLAVKRGFNEMHSEYTGDEFEASSPMPRKRNCSENKRRGFAQREATDHETFSARDHVQHSHRVKQEKAVSPFPDEDLYGVSDREEELGDPRQSKRARYQSPSPKRFQSSNNIDIVIAPRLMTDEDYQLHSRPRSKVASITSISDLAQKSNGFRVRRKHIYSTSSPESDSDVEIIETSSRPLPSALKSPSNSPTKNSASASLSNPNVGIQERLNAFEHRHKIPKHEFEAQRLHSPSTSPESQQTFYPSAEISPSFGNHTLPSSNKSVTATGSTVIYLESPEPEYQGGITRSESARSGMTSSERGQGCIDMTNDMETVFPGTLSSRTINRNDEPMDELQSRIASFRVAGGGFVRRNSL